ncbi:hypothetical protein UFOVP1219_23 [uncultured Caudovirales phage]|uniref:Uncharacterized protein n=1 Tax=uncultured Caudovirales phage TaxID=2100421 RepID=A0A6J5R2D5_9CAUD|nr:hypothetical protein UFOVP476_69 [uncultured Caudovirales phage]CAB4176054.1 hypothetical protein UFOVP986_6 [uncultured Caudovirales phage]CAB4191069.1 hypothetical protein UFOVP1219_23 [uncultured Caudovirales phage]CAB4223431.1 hypothetical protein UFOVP1671_72 [uncultured Caudovirales phage]CAB5220515.1 hypothetical protein UFOVP358_35 [uncultured Caudovirales phage]
MSKKRTVAKDLLAARIIHALRLPGEDCTDGECLDVIFEILRQEGYDLDSTPACEDCQDKIDFDETGGHIYPDGSVLCPQCDEVEV